MTEHKLSNLTERGLEKNKKNPKRKRGHSRKGGVRGKKDRKGDARNLAKGGF